jgi:hypothetical protein
MRLKDIVSVLLISLFFPLLLIALPQDLEVFTDFEDISGEGEFFIGEEPNRITVIGFKVETLEDPSLLHSGSKALTLGPGEEGKIFSQRGIQFLEFYAGETTGAGRFEIRGEINTGDVFSTDIRVNIVIGGSRGGEGGIIEGLPANISPGVNPPLYSHVGDSGDFFDTEDFDFLSGIIEVKFFNVMGKLVIDDLGFTLTDFPSNNTVYEDFTFYGAGDGQLEPLVIGISPNTATFDGGAIIVAWTDGPDHVRSMSTSYAVINGEEATITFETPAYKIDAFASQSTPPKEGFSPDGFIDVYDTNDNLLVTIDKLESDVTSTTKPGSVNINADELGAPGGIGKIVLRDHPTNNTEGHTAIDDFGFTPIGAPGTGSEGPPPATAPTITTQPSSQEVQSGASVSLSVTASGDDLTYQWYTGNSGDTASPVTGATNDTLTTGTLTVSTNYWAQVTNAGGSTDSDTATITVAAPSIPLVLDGSGDIAGENIQHANGNVFDQILLTGESIQLQARPGQITRVSFMDETEDIVQVEFSGTGTFTVTLDPATFHPPAVPPRYNQAVEYVTGKPSVVIDGADANTFFSIFTVGRINAFNQALFPEGQVYDAQADVTLVEVVNSTGMGGMQLSNAAFSASKGKTGVDARGVPIAVRLTVGDIDADGDAVPHLLFGDGSFTVAAGNPGLRITGGDLLQTNGASVVVAESGSTTTGFDTLITQNNFKSDNTPQPTLSIDATFANEDGNAITVAVEELTIE